MTTPVVDRFKAVQNSLPRTIQHSQDCGIGDIPRFMKTYGVNLNPDYQRDRPAWSLKQQQEFIGAALYDPSRIPPMWFNEISLDLCDVIDGKHRLQAILSWLNNDIVAICPHGERFRFSEFEEEGAIALRVLSQRCQFKLHTVKLTKVEVLRFYLGLNAGGTPHPPKELQKVRDLLAHEG